MLDINELNKEDENKKRGWLNEKECRFAIASTPYSVPEEPIYYTRQEVVEYLLHNPDELFEEYYNHEGQYNEYNKRPIVGMHNEEEIIYKCSDYPKFKMVVKDDKAKFVLSEKKFKEFTLAEAIHLLLSSDYQKTWIELYSTVDYRRVISLDGEYASFIDVVNDLEVLSGTFITKHKMV